MLEFGRGIEAETLSFRNTDEWDSRDMGSPNGVMADFRSVGIHLGDDERGPEVLFLALDPGVVSRIFPSHGHGSDNLRVTLRGSMTMGRDTYREGEFRLHEGLMPYPSDTIPDGPEGGWGVLIYGDRRGSATLSRPEANAIRKAVREGGSVDRTMCGPSAIATTLGALGRSAHINGSFFSTDGWRLIEGGTRASCALMGDTTRGPLVVLTDAPQGGIAFPSSTFSTEVLRVAICGGAIAGYSRTAVGDAQIKPAMTAWDEAVAGDGGAGEFIVFGDRRAVLELDASSEWEAAVQQMAVELAAELASRADLAPTG